LKGSTWVLQARQMDGRIGPFTVFADQMMTLNPLIVLVAVPVFEAWVYPAVGRCGCRLTPLRKMGAGGLLAALSFVLAGLLQVVVVVVVVVARFRTRSEDNPENP
jgi:dipeptide/tripeptide permease